MFTNNVVEDLTDGKQNGSSEQKDHRAQLAQDSENQDRLEAKESNQENQRCKLIQDVEGDVAIIGVGVALVPESGPTEASIKGNEACANEQYSSRNDEEAQGQESPIFEELVPNDCVQHQNPRSSKDHANMYRGECLETHGSVVDYFCISDCKSTYHSNLAADRNLSNRKDLANTNDDVGSQKQLHLPTSSHVNSVRKGKIGTVFCITNLLPTAARFFSDLKSKTVLVRMAMPQRIIEPRFPRCLSLLRGTPFSSHPPHGPVWLWLSERSYRETY